MARKNKQMILKMVQTAILTSVVLVLQSLSTFFPNLFQVMGTNLNLTLIPIVLGAVIVGPYAGAWLGLVSGIYVYVVGGVMGFDSFTNFLFINNPIITAGICIVKTTLAGFLAGLLYRLVRKKNELVAVFVAAAVTPIVNTGVFLAGCMVILDTITAFANHIPDFKGMNIMKFIFIILIGKNFIVELILNLLFAPGIQRIIHIVTRRKARG